MPRKRKPTTEPPACPICALCGEALAPTRIGRPLRYCFGCRGVIYNRKAATGGLPAWTHDLTPADRITPRMLQNLHGERFVQAANAIIARILDTASAQAGTWR